MMSTFLIKSLKEITQVDFNNTKIAKYLYYLLEEEKK